ncbi:acyltransferase [Bibersteinia trehalosi]|uniref:Acyltransferase n=1 Tax=Bibersteinia trehalosi TaxID=47735 RepID=A0A426FFW4_BIBTR|nr:acyltransferase [Bibersteinia trehalosi]RRN01639.1 acyltransferase [Bibersteinia trehalosi]
MQNAKCKMQNAKCKMQNAKCKMQNAKCKMQNAKWVGYYFLNRMLRILPAFWFSLFLFSFIVIPIFSDINFRDAFHFTWKAGTFHFFDYAWEIHNAFPDNFLKDNVNGSMWTLKHELACYIALPIIYFLCYGRRILLLTFNVVLLILVILSLSINYALWTIPVGVAWVISINEYHSFILFFYYFMTGVNLYLYRDKIIISKRWLMALSILFLFLSFWGGLKYILLLTLPYFFVVLGSLVKTNIFSRKGDFSYGMYIYAFPIQQVLINFLVNISPLQLTMYSLILTVILSIFSWFFIEKPFLKMKSFR